MLAEVLEHASRTSLFCRALVSTTSAGVLDKRCFSHCGAAAVCAQLHHASACLLAANAVQCCWFRCDFDFVCTALRRRGGQLRGSGGARRARVCGRGAHRHQQFQTPTECRQIFRPFVGGRWRRISSWAQAPRKTAQAREVQAVNARDQCVASVHACCAQALRVSSMKFPT